MSSPSPFDIGFQAAGGVSKGLRNVQDTNAIESILSQAMGTGDPQVLQDSIGKILSQVSPEKQGMAIQYLQNAYQGIQQKQQREQLRRDEIAAGLPPGLDPSVQAAYLKGKEPKSPLGGLGGTPLSPEESITIEDVVKSNPNATSDELAIEFNKRGVAPERAKPYIENRRRKEELDINRDTFGPQFQKLEAQRVSNFIDELNKEYKAAVNEDLRLNRMEVLDESGEVSAPSLVKALDAIGLPIGILSNPATEEFRKLESDFVRDVSQVFPGGKITNYEIQSYLRTVPNLMNSPEGRKEVIRNRKLMNEAKKLRYDEYQKIVKENNGKVPENVMILLEERTSDKMGDIEDRFIAGVQETIDKYQVPIPMLDPEGNRVNIPPNEIQRALNAGAKFQ